MKKFLSLALIFALAFATPAFAFSGDGRKEVAVAGTREALSAVAQPFNTLTVCAETNNTNPVTVGSVTVVGALATRRGIPLAAGVCHTIEHPGTLDEIYVDVITNTEGVTYFYKG